MWTRLACPINKNQIILFGQNEKYGATNKIYILDTAQETYKEVSCAQSFSWKDCQVSGPSYCFGDSVYFLQVSTVWRPFIAGI